MVCSVCKSKEIDTVNLFCKNTQLRVLRIFVIVAALLMLIPISLAFADTQIPEELLEKECPSGKFLAFKHDLSKSACVTPYTLDKLIERKWAIGHSAITSSFPKPNQVIELSEYCDRNQSVIQGGYYEEKGYPLELKEIKKIEKDGYEGITVSLFNPRDIKSYAYVFVDCKDLPITSVQYTTEIVVDNLTIPWSIDWLPDGTAIFTERNGNLRMIQDGELIQESLLSLGVAGVEGGMLGVAVDPDFEQNNYIYLYYTYNEFLTTSNKVVRYQLDDKTVTEDKVLMDGIPGGPFHDGGRIQFGPDGKLYITTGDAGNPDLSQDLASVAGKILRINPDGTIPEDNPWDDSPVYSIGHRNPQGIDWDNSGNLVATEHGPSGWRGSAHDEINVIIPGKNYGWPDVIGDESMEGLTNPILHTGDDTWAPSGAEFYDGDKIPQWSGKYFVATLRGSHLHMIDFDLENNKVISHEKLFQDEFGRLRDVQTGPDGYLYILTSNQDGRGFPDSNDDRILRIVPK